MTLFALQELVIVLAASLLIITLSQRLKIPAVVGFLLTGVLIGPSGLSLVGNTATVDLLAEIGVVMLLFTIGLEFSLETLKRLGKIFWLGGGIQVLMTIFLVFAGGRLLGAPPAQALLFGFLLTHTSTTVVLKISSDRDEVDTPPVRNALGVSLFQDLMFVPMAALIPVLAASGSVSPLRLSLRLALSLAVLLAVLLAARYVMPKILFLIVGTRVRELFIIASLSICLGLAVLSSALGLSLALGAFLAGIVISESDYSHQVVSDILPFKDVFSSLFFISIGMLLDLRDAWTVRSLIPPLFAAAVGLKLLTGFIAVRALKFQPAVAFLSAVGLIPIGEFSFVLAGVARASGLLSEMGFQAIIATSILTILVTPGFLALARAWTEKPGRLFKRGLPEAGPRRGRRDLDGHVIIAGYGLNGKNLAHILREAGIGYIILELNPETVRAAAATGEPMIFGDASSRVILREACIDKAKVIVFAISDPKATRRGVRAARNMNLDLQIIVRTRYAVELDGLRALGADDVIPEEFETSIEIFSRVLEKFHVPRNLIEAQVKVIRGECYGLLRGTCNAIRPTAERIADLLAAGMVETFFVRQGSRPIGKTLGELDLRAQTGATVIAVVRGGASFTSPGADFDVQAQDTLILVSNHRDIDRAFHFLEGASS